MGGFSFSEAGGILVPQPEIKLGSPTLEGEFLTTRPLRGTLASSLRSLAEGEGHEGFPPPPEKDLE